MHPETWHRISTLYVRAVGLPAGERAAFLDDACGDDAALRAELDAMLEHGAGPMDDDALRVLPSSDLRAEPLHVGAQAGPYRLEELLGRGGMGEVFRAIRVDDQFQQQVAIKVVRAERATPELTRRFLQERQIMAKLEHPGIATLLDGGIAPGGQPYLVMQYVKGHPITRYADERRLPLADRLQLFVKVCDAAQFAHRHLVVHRDLKPSNILVDEDGQPRLLDFGIAKLIDPAAAASTTGDLLLLTPEHAAPEQFLGDPVTTATDVYALGVLLYELLTGTRPFRDVPPPDLPRAVCEQTPRPPSAVRRDLPADLDSIVMMALRKEPERRYASAGQLGEDVVRFLGGWPVIARPDTARYRVRRFVGRNRVGVGAAALIAMTLVGATAVTAREAERRAAALEAAEAQRDRANRITEFLLGVFRATNPSETRGRTVTARELLDQAAARVRDDLAEDPAMRADMELAIGRAYAFIGLLGTADTVLGRAVAARREASPPDPLLTAEALDWHARTVLTLGRLQEGVAMMKEVVSLREGVLGSNAIELAPAYHRIGRVNVEFDPYDTSGVARANYEKALTLFRSADSVDQRAVAETLRMMASLTGDQGKSAEALALYEEAIVTARRAVDEDDPFLFNLAESLAHGLQANGHADSAIAIHRRLLESRRRVFGPDHMDVSFSLFNLGRDLAGVGRFDEALPLLRECVELRERLVGPDNYQTGYATAALARATAGSGDVGVGITLFQRAVTIMESSLGAENDATLRYLGELAALQVAAGRRDAAIATLTTAVQRGFRDLRGEEFAPLAQDRRFRALLDSLEPG
jgi:serine/threonine-protein kinase